MFFISFSYSNKISNIHPLEKLLLTLSFMLIAMQSTSPLIPLFIFTSITLILTIGVGFPILSFLRLLLLPYSFILISIIPILVDVYSLPSPKAVSFLFEFKVYELVFGISLYNIKLSFALVMRVMASVSCLYFLILTTPFTDIIALMKRFKFPSLLLELIFLTYQFFITMFSTIYKIVRAQRARLGYSSYINSFKSFAKLTLSLFDNLYSAIQKMFMSLESRLYSGKFLFSHRKYSLSFLRLLVIAFVSLFCVSIDYYYL